MNRLAPLLALGLLACASAPAAEVPFETTRVEQSTRERVRSAPGTVESVRKARLSAEVSGRVEALPYDAADAVEAGAVLVRLDDSDLRARLAVARAALAAAEARLKEARQEFNRTRRLYEQESASEQQMERATAALDRARAEQSRRKAEIGRLRIQLDKTTIAAPFGGVVVARHIETGELARPGTPLITLIDPERLRLVARVQESRLPELAADGRARAWVPALGERFPADRVTVIPQGDPRTHTFEVRLRLPAGTGASAGMFGRAELSLGTWQTLLVPGRAIVRRSEITGVYVVADERVSFRLVELGEETPDGWEVLAGLQPGERIALEPERALRYLKQARTAPEPAQSH